MGSMKPAAVVSTRCPLPTTLLQPPVLLGVQTVRPPLLFRSHVHLPVAWVAFPLSCSPSFLEALTVFSLPWYRPFSQKTWDVGVTLSLYLSSVGPLHLTLGVFFSLRESFRLAWWSGGDRKLCWWPPARPGRAAPRALSVLPSCSTASAFVGQSPLFSAPPSLPNVTRLCLLSASCSHHCVPPAQLFCLPCLLCIDSEHKGPGEDIPPGQPASVSATSVLGPVALCLVCGFGWSGSGSLVGIHTLQMPLFPFFWCTHSGCPGCPPWMASPGPASAGLCTRSLGASLG